jgi:hypothetical protein
MKLDLFSVMCSLVKICILQPSVEITCLWRSQRSLAEFGVNQIARWKRDNSKLAVTVSHLQITALLNEWCKFCISSVGVNVGPCRDR